MARVRTVKPEFWTDRRVGECSPSARLLFIASLNFADDEGGLDRSAKQLKAQAFPYDNIDCEPLVQELLNVGLLLEYEVAGQKYLHIKNFRKHQRIDKPQKARIPVYEHSENIPRTLQEQASTTHTRKGREGKGREEDLPSGSFPRDYFSSSSPVLADDLQKSGDKTQQVRASLRSLAQQKRLPR